MKEGMKGMKGIQYLKKTISATICGQGVKIKFYIKTKRKKIRKKERQSVSVSVCLFI